MCTAGHSWLASDVDACYLGEDDTFKVCFCPVSTCVETNTGVFRCQFSNLFYVLFGFALVLFWVGVLAYIKVARAVSALRDEPLEAAAFASRHKDVLRGVYVADSESHDNVALTHSRRGLATASGTFL